MRLGILRGEISHFSRKIWPSRANLGHDKKRVERICVWTRKLFKCTPNLSYYVIEPNKTVSVLSLSASRTKGCSTRSPRLATSALTDHLVLESCRS